MWWAALSSSLSIVASCRFRRRYYRVAFCQAFGKMWADLVKSCFVFFKYQVLYAFSVLCFCIVAFAHCLRKADKKQSSLTYCWPQPHLLSNHFWEQKRASMGGSWSGRAWERRGAGEHGSVGEMWKDARKVRSIAITEERDRGCFTESDKGMSLGKGKVNRGAAVRSGRGERRTPA